MHHKRTNSQHSHKSQRPSSTTLNLFIPSLHDATPLEACITVPSTVTTRKAAVFAHPYGPLGGTLHDPVVQTLRDTLVSHGYIVSIFNFRGVGHSKGSTSWTGKAETADYAAVVTWLLNFTAALPHPDGSPDGELQLLLGGYSYGALIAAQCPPASVLQATLSSSPPTGAFRAAIAAGTLSAQRWYESHSEVGRTSYSGSRSPATTGSSLSPVEDKPPPPPPLDLAALTITTRYLLVSPPLPPVSTFLLLSFFSFAAATGSILTPSTAGKWGGKSVLAAWGNEDVFTSAKKYRRWDEKMVREIGPTGFVGVEISGAGHFWGDNGLQEVVAAVGRWL